MTSSLKSDVKRAVEDSSLSRLKGLGVATRKRQISGRTAFNVMKAYVEESNNKSAECWPAQDRLAKVSGISVSSVAVAQDWLIEHGWLQIVARPIPGERGLHVRLSKGRIPHGTTAQRNVGTTQEDAENNNHADQVKENETMTDSNGTRAHIDRAWNQALIANEKIKDSMLPGQRECHDAEYAKYVLPTLAPSFD